MSSEFFIQKVKGESKKGYYSFARYLMLIDLLNLNLKIGREL